MVRCATVLIRALLPPISRGFYSHLLLQYAASCSHLPTCLSPMTAMLTWWASSVLAQSTTNLEVVSDLSAKPIARPPSAVSGRKAFVAACARTRGADPARRPSERGRRSLDAQYLTGLLTRGEHSVQKFHRTNTILQICYAFLPM